MRADNTMDSIKEALNGRPGQPIVFGVCKSLAKRFGCETWIVRGVTIVLAVFWTLPLFFAYILTGLLMKETEARTKGFFSGLAVVIREAAEKVGRSVRGGYHSNGYHGGYR